MELRDKDEPIENTDQKKDYHRKAYSLTRRSGSSFSRTYNDLRATPQKEQPKKNEPRKIVKSTFVPSEEFDKVKSKLESMGRSATEP